MPALTANHVRCSIECHLTASVVFVGFIVTKNALCMTFYLGHSFARSYFMQMLISITIMYITFNLQVKNVRNNLFSFAEKE